MKFIPSLLLVLFPVLAATAQIPVAATSATAAAATTYGTEPVRRSIIPYNRAEDAVAGDTDKSPFVATPLDWQIAAVEGSVEYATHFAVPVAWLNRQTILRVGYSATAFEVEVNGRRAGFSQNGSTPNEFNITKLVAEGRNSLLIRQLSGDASNALTPAASPEVRIADIQLLCQPTIRIRDILSNTNLNSDGDGVAEFGIVVKCDALNPKRTRLHWVLRAPDDKVLHEEYRDVELDMRREDTVSFSLLIPKEMLWSAQNPNLLRLDIVNTIEGRNAEFVSRRLGARAVEVNNTTLYVNDRAESLHLADYAPDMNLSELARNGHNGIVLTNNNLTESLLDECDRLGVYVVSCAAIDSSALGDSVQRGGNPTNDPAWTAVYIGRNDANFHLAKSHPSVIGFMVGRGHTSGINIHESYLYVKGLDSRFGVFYEGSPAEWCNDKVKIR